MSFNREEIFINLEQYLKDLNIFSLVSRRMKTSNDMKNYEFPACFIVQAEEMHENQRGLPTKVTFETKLIIIVKTGPQINLTTPSSILNPILDKLQSDISVQPKTGGRVNILKLPFVSHIWINRIRTSEGQFEDTEIAVIDLSILAVTNNFKLQ